MATEVELRAQIARLKEARTSGLKTVRDRDRHMEFRSDAELARAIADLEEDLAEVVTGRRRSRRRLTTTTKGL